MSLFRTRSGITIQDAHCSRLQAGPLRVWAPRCSWAGNVTRRPFSWNPSNSETNESQFWKFPWRQNWSQTTAQCSYFVRPACPGSCLLHASGNVLAFSGSVLGWNSFTGKLIISFTLTIFPTLFVGFNLMLWSPFYSWRIWDVEKFSNWASQWWSQGY